MPPSLLEAALYVDDLDAAEAFYGGVLGLERIARLRDRHVFYRLNGAVLLIFNPARTRESPPNPDLPVPPHGATGAGHLCLAASRAEIVQWRQRLGAAGVEIETEFTWPNGARSLYFRDPAGNSLECAEPRLWQA